RSDRRQAVGRGAIRTGSRPPLAMAAVVAEEDAAETMLDQPGRAVRALEAMPAGAAERQRRVTAPVQKEERLLLVGKRLPGRGNQRRRQEAAALRRFGAKVDGADGREDRGGVAVAEDEAPIAPGVGVDARFDRRR